MSEPVPCDRCGKDMRDPVTGVTFYGASVTFSVEDEKMADFLAHQLGRYKPNRNYQFCCECWLDALFGNAKPGV